MSNDKYKMASSCEGGNGVGVRVYVTVPDDLVFTEAMLEEARHICLAFYDKIQQDFQNNDPHEIAYCQNQSEQLLALFGDEKIYAEAIPNEYWPGHTRRYWFIVTTKVGHIKIGWRKRVISIDWSKTTVKTTAEELFPKEEVTKEERLIHAYGYEKAKEYVQKILSEPVA